MILFKGDYVWVTISSNHVIVGKYVGREGELLLIRFDGRPDGLFRESQISQMNGGK